MKAEESLSMRTGLCKTARTLVVASQVFALAFCGCGSTKSRLATEQLVMSDAVDQAISVIDFRPLSGHKVFLDTKYAQSAKGNTFVNSDYIISSVRQQMLASDLRLVDTLELSDVVVELRIGTLGTDSNDVVYGIPANNAMSGAASLVPNAPIVPSIPEIAVARREAQLGAAKVALFAYDRQTRQPVWQSGISKAKSTAQDVWVLGAGPFQRGTSVEGTQFAGTKLRMPRLKEDGTFDENIPVPFDQEYVFAAPTGGVEPKPVQVAGFVAPLDSEKKPPDAPPAGPAADAKPAPPAAGPPADAKPAPPPAESKPAEAKPAVPAAPAAEAKPGTEPLKKDGEPPPAAAKPAEPAATAPPVAPTTNPPVSQQKPADSPVQIRLSD